MKPELSTVNNEKKAKRKGRWDWFWNLLTLVLIFGILGVGLGYWYIFMEPDSPYNFFPPPTMPVLVILPTHTEVPPSPTSTLTKPPTRTPTRYLSPTRTLVPSLTPTYVTDTPEPSLTPTETITFTPEPTLTLKPNFPFPFMLQSLPASVSASVFTPNRGCDWMGVGGRVVDLQNSPATGITVQLAGTLNQKYILLTSLSGTALAYGPAGFEFTLSDIPIRSVGTLSIRLLDQAGLPLSEKVVFDTFDDCGKNLVLINFKQVR